MNHGKLIVGAALLVLAIPAVTQEQSAAPAAGASASQTSPQKKRLTINQRRELQQQRIGEGVEDGSVTAGEAARLERKEAGINKEIRSMKKDGNFTPAERARVQRQQNRLSREIYTQKHDAQTQNTNPTSEVGARQRAQQKRIGEGIESGQLTAGEATRLEHREAGINREVSGMRQANGGQLTAGERKLVNRQQNRTSRAIYRQKHDAQRRPR